MRGRSYVSVGRRVLPALLVFAAAIADASGDHGVARAALLCAVPFAAVAAIAACGECLEGDGELLATTQAILSGLVVALLVCSCAIRSTAVGALPASATSSLLAALGVIALKGTLACYPQLRRAAELWPAKP